MTVNEMSAAVGQKVLVRFEELHIECRVVDVKMSYGRPRLLVKPDAGTGWQWVELSRVVAGDDVYKVRCENQVPPTLMRRA